MTHLNKNLLKNILKVIIGISLILYLLNKIDLQTLSSSIKGGSYQVVVIACLVFGLTGIFQGARLYILIKKYGFTFLTSLKVFFISMFFNNLSTVLLGDGYKVVYLRNRIPNWRSPIAIVFLERFFGLVVILFIGMIYLIFNYSRILEYSQYSNILSKISFNYIIILAAPILLILLFLLRNRFKKVYLHFIQFFGEVKKIVLELPSYSLYLIIILTLFTHLLVAFKMYLLVKAFQNNILYVDTIFVILLVFIASYLPITIGALGVREGILILGFTYLGVTQPIAIVVAFVSRIIIYFYAILGGVLFLFMKKKQLDSVKVDSIKL